MAYVSKVSDFRFNYQNVVSFDDGETVQDVTVAYDYYPEENNSPYDYNCAEIYDVSIFNAAGLEITYDIPQDEYVRILEETKEEHEYLTAQANEV